MVDPLELVFLALVGVIAGFVDAIAGGGGLLALPALLWSGVTPLQALATSKLQGTIGTATATFNYWRHGLVDLRAMRLPVILTFVGSALGAWLVHALSTQFLTKLIPVLLIAIALYFLVVRIPQINNREPRVPLWLFALTTCSGIGFYDGFFGPGTGSFFTIACVLLLSYGLQQAIGTTKLLNFVSNIAALLVFIISGNVLWIVGLVMAAGQVTGSYLGSHLAIRHGAVIIRPLLVIVSLAISIKLLFQ